MSEPIRVELSRDEALVLFDLLQTWSDGGELVAPEDSAEDRVLSHVLGRLIDHLDEPLRRDYGDLLEGARDRLRFRP